MAHAACLHCGCTAEAGIRAHAVLALLATDDLDAAIDAGLLDAAPCDACASACNVRLLAAADARRSALAARERHRARALRLARRRDEREAARALRHAAPDTNGTPATPALPAAAADALARALARAARKPRTRQP